MSTGTSVLQMPALNLTATVPDLFATTFRIIVADVPRISEGHFKLVLFQTKLHRSSCYIEAVSAFIPQASRLAKSHNCNLTLAIKLLILSQRPWLSQPFFVLAIAACDGEA